MNFSLKEYKDDETVGFRPTVFTTKNNSYILYFFYFCFLKEFLAVEQLFKQLQSIELTEVISLNIT